MIFYYEVCVDGLVKREEIQIEMIEEYSNRDDFFFINMWSLENELKSLDFKKFYLLIKED